MTTLPSLPELHLHLDGSLRRTTLEELAAPLGVEVPAEVGFHAGMGLQEALACFDLTLSVLQSPDAVERVAREMCEDASAGGVTTLEIRFAPQLHGKIASGLDVPMEEIVDAALAGCCATPLRAGVILCALHGEPPALLDRFVEIARDRPGVVGIDLAGGPSSGHDWKLDDYAEGFTRAREIGLGRTVHAGEGRPPEEIRIAIDRLHAQRIGHGTSLLEDPSVLELVLERGVTIEACLTSNVHTGAIPALQDHPLPAWLQRGVAACINADNTLFSHTDAAREHRIALEIPGMNEERLAETIGHGHASAFRRS